MKRGSYWLFVAALMWSPTSANAADLACEGAEVLVSAPSPSLARSVCASVAEALDLLAQCDLGLTEPINIAVLDDLENVSDTCFGMYECESNTIRVRSPDGIAQVSGQTALYAGLDPSIVFDSIVVHEVSHAAFAQTACTYAQCLANHEYVASAMQMWSLPPSIRRDIVDRFGQDKPVEPMRLNAIVVAMVPEKFAALAWQHFEEDANGCDFVQDLATGRASLEIVWE